MSTEGVAGHFNAAVASALRDAPGDRSAPALPGTEQAPPEAGPLDAHRHGPAPHAPSHPAPECTPGQPQQGVAVSAPCPSPLGEGLPHPWADGHQASPDGVRAAASPPWASRSSVVLRV
ncbi:hypothetical protein HCK00_20860 [Streptomyces sp. PLAI1-29]|uniref:Uncharacterized protein n=1 Tax=Streptomyces zingiberis TaxID=2053010 RepID=A0ABX1BZ27_9ACTN|nr:hypothetical protein [Streptomyces zingiberis]